ncbi:hypothetical protein IC762_12710 [Bradyrhizobium genosp. L]|uniref:hypothetical protein n=1 Tax=Bradyrhizobium genosp. L TaxID=83637 RepID=UPI0018A33126|nr:hypothetical protein [Bradyrhizobium genosp. L]QPF87101.1 hypothetical protein IC762_12710 [Bradyrhizobium genosp. L]
MQQLTLLRALGACVAVALATYAGLSFVGDLAQPAFHASDLFLGRSPAPGAPSAGLAARLSLNGDLLADAAAVKAAKPLGTPGNAEDNTNAQDAVVAALDISPIRPALWLALGQLRTGSSAAVAPALKMSYLTGTVPVEVALARLQAVTSTPAALDEEVKLLAQSDVRATLANGSHFQAPLIGVYVKATAAGKALLLDATRSIDPKFNATLQRY